MAGKGGFAYWVDDVWRKRVQDELDRRGWKPAGFLPTVGVSKSAWSELMSGKHHTVKNLPRIHSALGFPPPRGPLLSERHERMANLLGSLHEDAQESVLAMLGTLIAARKTK